MQQHHFTEIFTSLHIPEDNQSSYATRMKEFLNFVTSCHLKVFVDIDKNSYNNLPNDLDDFYLRLDDGFSNQEIAQISQEHPLALNASTLSQLDVTELHEFKANFKNIEAWHNFYPRPETGLDFNWFLKRNHWLKSLGITTQAFVPGNEQLRGPIFKGLPTIEDHRNQDILASAIELKLNSVDKIFIGDPRLDLTYQKKFDDYFTKDVLDLTVETKNLPTYLTKKILHNRPDPAKDVVRIVESRGMNALNKDVVEPDAKSARTIGSITIDNQDYGRYMGEVQITKTDLPLDQKVNVLGRLDQRSIQLLPFIGASQAIQISTEGY